MTPAVTDTGDAGVLFTFANSGPTASYISEVYFDDDALLTNPIVINSIGVLFVNSAVPPNLPGAIHASPAFHTTVTLSVEATAPTRQNGVNPGEVLGVRFSLQAGTTFGDVVDALEAGGLRIGLFIQGLPAENGNKSLSVVNLPLPEPATLFPLGLGLGLIAFARKRQS